MRALAVVLVVVYHFWPHRLAGGYVGVDVFFVISGFLITSHLISHPVSRPREVLTFWARRVRRLIPASALVLISTLVATVVWLPETVRIQVSKEVIAASLYVENWFLYGQATDYLAEGNDASPTQHYWSLSIEEQFYIVWPLLIAVVVVAMRRMHRDALAALGAVALTVSVGSLAWSMLDTATSGGQVYFSTFTRMWELALGGVLAWAVARWEWSMGSIARAVLAWSGILAIVVAALLFTSSTPFPGWAALLPTLGAAAVLAADSDDRRGGPSRLLSVRPVQWVGDASYSIYLWHWPVVVILPAALGSTVFWPVKAAALVVVVILAGASRRWVEEPLRKLPVLVRSNWATFAMLGALTAFTVALAGALWWHSEREIERQEAALEVIAEGGHCVGADAFRDDTCGPQELAVTPVVAAEDKPDVYADECWSNRPFADHIVCEYGLTDADVRIALHGNSHAGHWQPPLTRIATEDGWALDTYLVSECYSVDVPINFDTAEERDNCLAYNEWAAGEISSGAYDVVVMSDRTATRGLYDEARPHAEVQRESYARVIQRFVDSGVHVLVIRDTPAAAQNIPNCIAEGGAWQERCATDRETALEVDPLADAAEMMAGEAVTVLDVTELLCTSTICPAAIGSLITYFDHGHMTATFSRTLVPEVRAALDAARR